MPFGTVTVVYALLQDLGYEVNTEGTGGHHPEGRRAFFVGDLVDRGPATPAVLRLVMGMVDAGHALWASRSGSADESSGLYGTP